MRAQSGPVLIVSGDPGLRELLTEVLADEGYGTAADDYAGALETLGALGGRVPALVLLDLYGPGRALSASLARPLGGAVPVVGLTTHPAGAGATSGTAALLPLPFEFDDLMAMVTRFIGTDRN